MSYEEDLSEKVQFEIIDQVAWITINNPDKGNAMSPGMRDRMTGLFESLNGQFDARAVVLTATGQSCFAQEQISQWAVSMLSVQMMLLHWRSVNQGE